jgi:hypothetical protein
MNGQEYIVNLANQIVGESAIKELEKKYVEVGVTSIDCRVTPSELGKILWLQIKTKVSKMNSRTIGYICGFGLGFGVSGYGKYDDNFTGFIRQTSIYDIRPEGFFPSISGRSLIEDIAVATVASVVYDIINQNGWEADRTSWQMDRAYKM